MRRVAIIAGGLAVSAAAIAVACSFPTVTVTNITPDATDQTTSFDGSKPGDVDPNGADAEAGIVDAGVVADANCCDCDGDESLAVGADASCGDASRGDCDDLVAAVHPDGGFVLNSVWPSAHQPKFDWDCDGKVTKQLNYNLKCALGPLGQCSGEGFEDDPACGTVANYFTCKAGIGTCTATSVETRQQACR